MINLVGSSGTFVGTPPDWRVDDAHIALRDGRSARLTQKPFVWVEGAWQSDVTIEFIDPPAGIDAIDAVLRVTPDTLRRWSEVNLDPIVESCAQLGDHVSGVPGRHAGMLTLL